MPDPTPEAFPQAFLGFPFIPVDPQGWWSPRADLVLTGVNAQIIASVTFSVASTPPPGAFLVAYLGQRNANSASVTLALWGLTWTTVKRQPFDSNDTQFLLTATVPPTGIPSNTGTAVVTFSGAGNGMGIQVWQFLGADQTFTPRIRQIVAGNRDASWTPFVNFTSPLIPSSAVVAFEQNDDGLAIAPPAGFTERIDQALSTNQMEGALLYPAGSQGQTVTWGGAMTNSGVLAVEVQMEPFPTGLDPASRTLDPIATQAPFLLFPAFPTNPLTYDTPQVGSFSLFPPAGSHTWAGTAPSFSTSVPTAAGSVVWAGTAPSFTTGLPAPAGSHTWVGTAPQLQQTVPVTAGSHVWAGTAPGFAIALNLFPPAGSHTWAATAPQMQQAVPVTAGSHTWAGTAPAFKQTIPVTAGSHVWAGTAPVVSVTMPVVAGAHVWAGVAPGFLQSLSFFPGAGSHTWAGAAPGLTGTVLNIQHVQFVSNSIPGQIRRR